MQLSYFTLPLAVYLKNKKGKKAWKWDDTSFPQMGEEGCGSRNPTRSLLIFTIFDDFAFAFSWKNRERKGWKEKGKFVFFASCLLPCLPLAFGLFSIFPERKSFKHLKRYILIKN